MPTRAKKQTRGKGVTLRRHGNPETGAFVVTFRDPRYWQDPKDPSKGRKVVRRSLKTRDRVYAERCQAALDKIIRDRVYWGAPPEDCPPVVFEIWLGAVEPVTIEHDGERVSVAPADDATRQTEVELDLASLDPSGRGMTVKAGLLKKLGEQHIRTLVDDYSDADKAKSFAGAVRTLQRELGETRKLCESLQAELQALETENKALRHRLRLYNKRAEKAAKIGTLQEELDAYLNHYNQKKVHSKRKGILASTLKRFVKDVGGHRRADDVTEDEVSKYIEAYKRQDGRQIGEERRKEIRAHICTFLESATQNIFSRKAVRKVSAQAIGRERKPIVWLEDDEAERLVSQMYELHGEYWGDAARIQLNMGWRPSELTLLQTEHASKESIHLVSVFDPDSGVVSAKTGERSLPVPKVAKAAVERRIDEAKGGLLFPAIRRPKGRGKEKGRKNRKNGLLASAWSEDHFYKQYTSKLREAAAEAGITKPIDGRTLRRTFGSLLLRDKKYKRTEAEVAAVMGNQPKVVARHYARIESHEIDLNISASTADQAAGPES